MIVGDISSAESLSQDLKALEQAVNDINQRIQEQQQQQQQKQKQHEQVRQAQQGEGEPLSFYDDPSETNTSTTSHNTDKDNHKLLIQLAQLSQTTEALALGQAFLEWIHQAPILTENTATNLLAEAEWCQGLANVLLKYPNVIDLGGGERIYNETYLAFHDYIYQSLTKALRHQVQLIHRQSAQNQKPKNLSTRSSRATIQEGLSSPVLGQICAWLFRLHQSHMDVLEAVQDSERLYQANNNKKDPATMIVTQLLRPLVDRVEFHFVQSSPDRPTSTQVSRLPEWLLSYIKEHALGRPISANDQDSINHSPNDSSSSSRSIYHWIHFGLPAVLTFEDATILQVCFWNELIRLIQWVLTERKFFRHPDIASPKSDPTYLYNAMEQFLLFDRILRELSPSSSSLSSSNSARNGVEIFGLMDVLVMADEELCTWWMEREREYVFSTLFEKTDIMVDVPKPLANHVSPRAEVFCALIRSVQWKASTLTSPGLYLRHVAVPLCSQFVDALHETSTDLQNLLCQPARRGCDPLQPEHLTANFHEWVEIINGTHLASMIILKHGAWQDGMPSTSQSDHDLARFGRSLDRLTDVLVEEFAASFVETLLMERARFAAYLMMASHLLASKEWEGDDADLSTELQETRRVLALLHKVCDSILHVSGQKESDTQSYANQTDETEDPKIAHFAPRAIQVHIMSRVADKFLEVILDVHAMTPDLWKRGCDIFARDVTTIVGRWSMLPIVKRLLDTIGLLTMNTRSSQGLMAALGGLVGEETDFLMLEDFSSDEKIYDEAELMLKAKGFSYLELKDAISILNRRRD